MLPPRRTEANEQNLEASTEYGLDRREPITEEYVIDFEVFVMQISTCERK